jgi:PilZ domain
VTAMEEKRKHPRHRTFLRGKVEFNNRASSLDCTIRDLSDGGARLELAETVAIPEHFELSVPAKGLHHAGYVKWRTKTHIGIAFAKPLSLPSETNNSSLERRVRELEAENGALRRQLAEYLNAEKDKQAI